MRQSWWTEVHYNLQANYNAVWLNPSHFFVDEGMQQSIERFEYAQEIMNTWALITRDWPTVRTGVTRVNTIIPKAKLGIKYW